MCGRFNEHLPLVHSWSDLLGSFPNEHAKSYNRPPSTTIAAFRSRQAQNISGELMRWGLVPNWSKEFDSKYATFNARIESIEEKPSYKNAWHKKQRCLIPMAGYYEWQAQEGGKQPFYITDRDVGCLVSAGLYETWNNGNAEKLSCTMITKPAEEMLANIHQRMPTLLTPEQGISWLNGELDDKQLLENQVDSIIAYPVSKLVGNTRNDQKELINPIDINK